MGLSSVGKSSSNQQFEARALEEQRFQLSEAMGGEPLAVLVSKTCFFIFKADEWSAIPGELRGGLNGLGMGIACVC